MTDADTAYANAEQAIAKAKAEGATELRLDSRSGFKALTTLPPEIADLTTLSRLDLDGTQITDLTRWRLASSVRCGRNCWPQAPQETRGIGLCPEDQTEPLRFSVRETAQGASVCSGAPFA